MLEQTPSEHVTYTAIHSACCSIASKTIYRGIALKQLSMRHYVIMHLKLAHMHPSMVLLSRKKLRDTQY